MRHILHVTLLATLLMSSCGESVVAPLEELPDAGVTESDMGTETPIPTPSPSLCEGITCSGKGTCAVVDDERAGCICDLGFRAEGLECIPYDAPPSECIPLDCAALGANCGLTGDGCGAVLDCGQCGENQTCGAQGPNQCGVGACEAATCASLGEICGMHGDGCGAVLNCGECTPMDPPRTPEPLIVHERVRLTLSGVSVTPDSMYY